MFQIVASSGAMGYNDTQMLSWAFYILLLIFIGGSTSKNQ